MEKGRKSPLSVMWEPVHGEHTRLPLIMHVALAFLDVPQVHLSPHEHVLEGQRLKGTHVQMNRHDGP